MNEAYVLLNVDYKKQKNLIEEVKKNPTVKTVKTTYGIYDVLIILESSDMQELKNSIDVHLHGIDGISNLTTLISVS